VADAGEPSWTARLGSVVREAVRGLGLTGADNEEADVLRASLEDWLDGESLRAFVAGVGRDQVTAPEAQITLTVRLSRIARLRAERVRFFVGGRAVGEVEVGHADLVSLPHRCDAPGLFEVGFEPVDADGVPGRRAASARLHVVPRGQPLAAVDVGRIVDEDLLIEFLNSAKNRGIYNQFRPIDPKPSVVGAAANG